MIIKKMVPVLVRVVATFGGKLKNIMFHVLRRMGETKA